MDTDPFARRYAEIVRLCRDSTLSAQESADPAWKRHTGGSDADSRASGVPVAWLHLILVGSTSSPCQLANNCDEDEFSATGRSDDQVDMQRDPKLASMAASDISDTSTEGNFESSLKIHDDPADISDTFH